mgnify:CR=1 FL=1
MSEKQIRMDGYQPQSNKIEKGYQPTPRGQDQTPQTFGYQPSSQSQKPPAGDGQTTQSTGQDTSWEPPKP